MTLCSIEKERSRELKLSTGGRRFTAAASSPATKRQERMPSVVNKKRRGEGDSMEKSENDDEGCRDSGDESMKRIRLQGKVAEGCNPVDPGVVPRRLRSAMRKKRSGQPASLAEPDSKKKRQFTQKGTHLSLLNGTRRFKESMVEESPETTTKDEEEIAEVLSSWESFMAPREPLEEERNETLDKNAPSFSLSQASKEVGTKVLLPCSGAEATNPPFVEESGKETLKDVREQELSLPEKRKFDLEFNGTTQPRDSTKSSNTSGASLPLQIGNRLLPPSKLVTLPACKPETVLWPFDWTLREKELQSFMQRSDKYAHIMCQKETREDSLKDLPNKLHSAMSSNKVMVRPDFASTVCRPSSTGNNFPSEKLPLVSAHKRPSWKRSTTHVCISKFIQTHESEKQGMSSSNQFKDKKKVESRNALSTLTKNIHESRLKMLPDGGRHPLAHQASVLPGTYVQKKQDCDFLSLFDSGETSTSRHAMKTSGHLNYPYLHSQVSRHTTTLPFNFPNGSYTSPYPGQLEAAAFQQLKLPLYTGGNNPLYGQHKIHAGGATKQYLQILQTQNSTKYRLLPRGGDISTQQWPSERRQQHEASSSLASSDQPPPIVPRISPPLTMPEKPGGPHHAAPSSSFCSGASAQMQLLCNPQRM